MRRIFWFLAWAAFIYSAAFAKFLRSIPPQGLERSSYWHVFFAIPALLTVGSSTAVLWSQQGRGINGAIRGAVVAFIMSTIFSFVDCTVMPSDDEAQAWAGIPLLHVIFFATFSGAVVGALGLLAKPTRS